MNMKSTDELNICILKLPVTKTQMGSLSLSSVFLSPPTLHKHISTHLFNVDGQMR